eukprot:TRINITY_DN1383_c0_g1_i2.p2 TRINITY_DN1383_c0_g1~~TRINITY_DN1383_c0_g1_i2.p2  ORF type:complete len:190 (-),score=30.47 TRINITY_DN1383_c0_g1_i2:65-634(-)
MAFFQNGCFLCWVLMLSFAVPNVARSPLLSPVNGANVTHFAVVVGDIGAAALHYSSLFGIELDVSVMTASWTWYRSQFVNSTCKVSFAPIGPAGMSIEVIQPIGGPSFWQELLSADGPSLHHYGVMVDDFDATVQRLAVSGYKLVQISQLVGHWVGCYAYFDARDQIGAVLEILQPGISNCSQPPIQAN